MAVDLLPADPIEHRVLREVLDRLPIGVAVFDAEGVEVARSGRAAGFSGDRTLDALIEAAVRESVAGARATGRHERVLELHGPPALVVRVEAWALAGGGTVVVVEDVSERRQLDAVRRDFIANVSHELRTPIGAIGVLAEAMAEEQEAAVLRRLAGRVTAEADRAARLVSDLLDLSRIEADAPRGERERVPLATVLDAARQRVEALAERSRVSVTVHPPPAHVAVHADREQLVSAVVNLLDNAVAYSDAGGTVDVNGWEEGAGVCIAVRDRGVGIPAKDLDRVFERFYRVDRARDRRTGGTGLGLSIVRHVAVNHGGEVTVESQEGKGSTFTLRLPVAADG